MNPQKKSNIFWGYLMSAPTVIGLIILNIIPFFFTIYLSFSESDGLSSPVFVGLSNFTRMFQSKDVLLAVWNTLYYTLLSVPLGIFLSLIFAVFLNTKIKGKGLYRTIFFLPMVVAPAAIAMVWKWVLNSNFGILNYLLSLIGLDKIGWLIDSNWVLPSLALVTIWSTLGYNLIILLAGLQNIPTTYYEAADIDGAGPIRKFINITVPLVSPMLFFTMVTQLMAAVKQFDYFYIMLDVDNPVIDKCHTLLYLFYEYAFIINEKGYASAIVLLAFAIIMSITACQFWLQNKWVHYD